LIVENDIAKSRKSFNQANQGSDNVADYGGKLGKAQRNRIEGVERVNGPYVAAHPFSETQQE